MVFHFRVTHFLAVLTEFCDKEKTLKFSVRKSSLDTSLPVPKKNLVLIYAEDVVSMPQTNERGILAANDVQIAFGAEMYELYLTPSSQKSSADTDGDLAAMGWKRGPSWSARCGSPPATCPAIPATARSDR